MAQKSPPSGAPTSAAAASIAVTPGSTRMSSAAPRRIARFDRLEDRRRHGEHAGIAARHDDDLPAGRGERQRKAGAIEFDAIVRGVPALVAARGNAVEIGAVAHEVGRTGERRLRRRRHQLGLARPGADHDERAAHSRLPSPGISTMAK